MEESVLLNISEEILVLVLVLVFVLNPIKVKLVRKILVMV
jgi:hypothetical protein